MSKVLIIDDDTYISNLLEEYLNHNKYNAKAVYSGINGLKELKKRKYDLVLCDFRLPDADGLEMLREIKKINPSLPVIIITAYADVRMAVKLMKLGAQDYVTKPIYQEEILELIDRILKSDDQTRANVFFEEEFILGDSPKMQEIMNLSNLVAATNMTVLIQGETGSGKEFIARYIHLNSQRKNKKFVAVDCGAIPKDLANSELFGHIKGSFTGAINDKVGVFEQANGGTLFLDEIGNLTHAVQTKLLRVFQEKVVTKLGDTKPKKVDVRIIAATNEDLTKEVEEKNFREDLFHRINEFKVYLPSLRERPEDIPVFAEHFLKQANKALKRNVKGFDEQVIRAFTNYPWHGNLRELNNVVKRSVLLSPGEYVTINALPGEIKNNPYLADITPEPVYHQEQVTSLDLKQASVEAEKRIIMNALSDANFNKTKAAKLLNIDRKTLYNKIKQFNINLD